MSRKVTVVFCPYLGSSDAIPHLGIARIAQAVKQAGYLCRVLDANALVARQDPEWFLKFCLQTNIGHDIPRISFLFGMPELLWSLADPEADPPPPESMTADAGSATVQLPKDLHARAEKIADLVLETDPAVALLSTYISNHAFTCHMAQELRRKRPTLPLVWGGPGVYLPPVRKLLSGLELADAFVVGEGEWVVPRLLEDYFNGGFQPSPGVELAGGEPAKPAPLQQDLALLPILDVDDFRPPENIPRPPGAGLWPRLTIEGSRGCRSSCTFCTEKYFWARFRSRPPDRVVEEIAHLYQRYGVNYFNFTDTAMNHDPEWLDRLVALLMERKLDVHWVAEFIPSFNLTPERCHAVREAGCVGVNLGTETLLDKYRKLLGKRENDETIEFSIANLYHEGLFAFSHILIGYPGQTPAEMADDMARLADLYQRFPDPKKRKLARPDLFRVEPFTPMYTHAKKFGIDLETYSFPIPQPFLHLEETIREMSVVWQHEMSARDRMFYAGKLKKLFESGS